MTRSAPSPGGFGRRPDEFRPQLIAALKIIEEKHAHARS
jgi:membrane-bound lytic murein transglycosylase B